MFMPVEILYFQKRKTIVKTFIPDSILLVQKNNHRFTLVTLKNRIVTQWNTLHIRFYSQNDRLLYVYEKQNDYNFSLTGPVN